MDKKLYSQHQVELQKLRQEANLHQQDLADLINEPQSFVSKVEIGERRLDILELREVCEALGVSHVEFVSRLEARLSVPP